MKKAFPLMCTALLSLIINVSFAQKKNPLELQFIKDYPIKIDGGCSLYTYDTTDLRKNKYIFIVNAKKRVS